MGCLRHPIGALFVIIEPLAQTVHKTGEYQYAVSLGDFSDVISMIFRHVAADIERPVADDSGREIVMCLSSCVPIFKFVEEPNRGLCGHTLPEKAPQSLRDLWGLGRIAVVFPCFSVKF